MRARTLYVILLLFSNLSTEIYHITIAVSLFKSSL